MSFDQEWDDIVGAETSGNYIDQPGVCLVTIKGYKMSPNDHKGVPFIEFTFETLGDENGANKASTSSRLYRVQSGDSETKKAIKNKKIKELLQNAGADFGKKGEDVVKSSIGKVINALFKQSEYISVNKDENNKPVIKTKVDYSFSAPKNKDIQGTRKYLYSVLNEQDQNKFEGLLAQWNQDNGGGSSSTQNTSPTAEEYQNQGAGTPEPTQAINPNNEGDSDF